MTTSETRPYTCRNPECDYQVEGAEAEGLDKGRVYVCPRCRQHTLSQDLLPEPGDGEAPWGPPWTQYAGQIRSDIERLGPEEAWTVWRRRDLPVMLFTKVRKFGSFKSPRRSPKRRRQAKGQPNSQESTDSLDYWRGRAEGMEMALRLLAGMERQEANDS